MAKQQEAFWGAESAQDRALGITASYCQSLDSINKTARKYSLKIAQEKGRDLWHPYFYQNLSGGLYVPPC